MQLPKVQEKQVQQIVCMEELEKENEVEQETTTVKWPKRRLMISLMTPMKTSLRLSTTSLEAAQEQSQRCQRMVRGW